MFRNLSLSKTTKTPFVNGAVFLLSLLCVLIISEIFIRIFVNQHVERLGHHEFHLHHELFVQYHSLLGWSKIPNRAKKYITSEYTITESMNSEGIRGPEYSYNKGDDEYRILVLGDSFAEGYTVEFSEVFSEVLKRRLNAGGQKQYEIINAGTGGYSTDQELLFFQHYGKMYTPDLTILTFFSNDVRSNNADRYWRGFKPLYKLEGGELKLTNVPVPPPLPHSSQDRTQNVTSDMLAFKKTKKWLYKNSYLYRFITTRIRNVHYLYALALKLGLAETPTDSMEIRSGIVPIPGELRVWQKTYNEKIRSAWDITEALIRKLREETSSVGSELLVFYVPERAAVYEKEWEATRGKYGISDANWSIEQVGVELERICKRNNINLINPTEIFKKEAGKLATQSMRLYFRKDPHWNRNGHKLVGDILAEYIESVH